MIAPEQPSADIGIVFGLFKKWSSAANLDLEAVQWIPLVNRGNMEVYRQFTFNLVILGPKNNEDAIQQTSSLPKSASTSHLHSLVSAM